MISDDLPIPCCKPLRLAEAFILALCLSLLILIPAPKEILQIIVKRDLYIYFFSTYTPLLIILIVDILGQICRNPVVNIPMICFSAIAFCMCTIAGIRLLVVYGQATDDKDTHRTLVLIAIMGFLSLFVAMVYLMDVTMILACARRYPTT